MFFSTVFYFNSSTLLEVRETLYSFMLSFNPIIFDILRLFSSLIILSLLLLHLLQIIEGTNVLIIFYDFLSFLNFLYQLHLIQ